MLYGIITNSIRASRRTQRTFFSFRSHSKCLLSYFKLFWRCDAANNWTLMRSGDNGSVYTVDRWKRHTIIIFAEWPMIAHRSALIMINAILFLDHRWPSPVCTHDDDNNGNNHVSMPFAYIESKTQVKCAVKMRLPEISHTRRRRWNTLGNLLLPTSWRRSISGRLSCAMAQPHTECIIYIV